MNSCEGWTVAGGPKRTLSPFCAAVSVQVAPQAVVLAIVSLGDS